MQPPTEGQQQAMGTRVSLSKALKEYFNLKENFKLTI